MEGSFDLIDTTEMSDIDLQNAFTFSEFNNGVNYTEGGRESNRTACGNADLLSGQDQSNSTSHFMQIPENVIQENDLLTEDPEAAINVTSHAKKRKRKDAPENLGAVVNRTANAVACDQSRKKKKMLCEKVEKLKCKLEALHAEADKNKTSFDELLTEKNNLLVKSGRDAANIEWLERDNNRLKEENEKLVKKLDEVTKQCDELRHSQRVFDQIKSLINFA